MAFDHDLGDPGMSSPNGIITPQWVGTRGKAAAARRLVSLFHQAIEAQCFETRSISRRKRLGGRGVDGGVKRSRTREIATLSIVPSWSVMDGFQQCSSFVSTAQFQVSGHFHGWFRGFSSASEAGSGNGWRRSVRPRGPRRCRPGKACEVFSFAAVM